MTQISLQWLFGLLVASQDEMVGQGLLLQPQPSDLFATVR